MSYTIVYTVGFLTSLWLILCRVLQAVGKCSCRPVVRRQRKCFLSPARVVFLGVCSCLCVPASACKLCVSVWYMYSEIIFVLNNQCDNEKQVKTSQD